MTVARPPTSPAVERVQNLSVENRNRIVEADALVTAGETLRGLLSYRVSTTDS